MSNSIIERHPANPILTSGDIPYQSTLVFNAGITKFAGEYIMLFRNDYGMTEECFANGDRKHETNLGLARSDDGVRWRVDRDPVLKMGDRTDPNSEIKRVYDPRLSVIDSRVYMCFAMDTKHGLRGGVAVSEDLKQWHILSMSVPDNRNMVLFPERINGKFCRLERPFPVYSRPGPEQFDIWFSDSPDCQYWGNSQLVLGAEHVPYGNSKIGPAAPPVKTAEGWLTTIHAVYDDPDKPLNAWKPQRWTKRYMGGLILLDLHEPWKVIGMARQPLLDPDPLLDYESHGFRGSVIFPGGMILEDDGQVKIYYGAADTVECLATSTLDKLLGTIEPYVPPHHNLG